MAVGSIESFTLIVLTLIAVVCAQNEPDVWYTCDQTGMHINMTFDHPFRGLVFVEGYKKNAKCRLAFNVPVLEAIFNIPLMACDLNMPWVTAIVMIQQHPLLPTINDTTEAIACPIEINRNVTNWAEVSRNAQESLSDFPDVIAWLEFGLAPGVFDNETEYNSNNTNFMAFRVYGANRFNDMLVTECIAYNESFIAPNTSIHQMTEPIGCPDQSTEMLSTFNVTKSDREVITGAYAEFYPLSIPNPEQAFISCSAVLCVDECQCSQNSSALGFQVFATRKLVPRREERSASYETARSHDGIGNSLKSTIKALTNRLMKFRRQDGIQKEDADFMKRSMPCMDEGTTAELVATQDSKSNPTLPERVHSTDFITDSNCNIETKNSDEKNECSANISALSVSELELQKFISHMVEVSSESPLHHKSTALSVPLIPQDAIEKMYRLYGQTTEGMVNAGTTEDSNEDVQQKIVLIETTETGGLKLESMVNEAIVNEKEPNDSVQE